MNKIYDVLIVGGGVAGMSAGIYAKRSGKDVAIIERMELGGTVATLGKINNFPSQKQVEGFELARMFEKQVKSLDVEIVYDDIVFADLRKEEKLLTGKIGQYQAKRVVIATGLSSEELGKNESKYFGKGVSYCAVCDGNFFKGKKVCVASRNGRGIKDAKYLANIASEVVLLDEGNLTLFSEINKIENLKVISNASVQKVTGKHFVEGIEYVENGQKCKMETSALFVSLGNRPKVELFGDELEIDEAGFIKTDENMQTSIKGVYAVGDVRNGVLKQIVTACSDGAIAGKKSTEGI